jgi:hypothetical protein
VPSLSRENEGSATIRGIRSQAYNRCQRSMVLRWFHCHHRGAKWRRRRKQGFHLRPDLTANTRRGHRRLPNLRERRSGAFVGNCREELELYGHRSCLIGHDLRHSPVRRANFWATFWPRRSGKTQISERQESPDAGFQQSSPPRPQSTRRHQFCIVLTPSAR